MKTVDTLIALNSLLTLEDPHRLAEPRHALTPSLMGDFNISTRSRLSPLVATAAASG